MALPLPQDILGPNFTNFLLPWIFTFAIVYGLLIKVNIFGAGVNQKVSVALAFVIAFFVSATGGPQLGAFFTSLFGGAATFVAGILVVVLFLALAGYKTPDAPKAAVLAVLVILGVILFLISQGPVSGFKLDQQTASLIFWAIVILAVIYYVAHEGVTTPAAGAAQPQQPGR